ncbi:hypothetical protein TKK_0011864 [Trichogramma kaykai]
MEAPLKILQWNCRSIQNKLDLHLHSEEYDIIIIIETWLKPEKNFNLKNFNCIRFDRNDELEHGGIAIYAKQNINCQRIDFDTDLDSLELGAISFQTNTGEMIVVACYRSPTGNNTISLNDIGFVTGIIEKFDKFLVVGDFNAHHPFWGSRHSCASGSAIYENLDWNKFFLFNSHDYTHYYFHEEQIKYSYIDLSFCSMNLAMATNWKVMDDPWGSDHFPIDIEINVAPSRLFKKTYRHNLHGFDWEKFQTSLNEAPLHFNSIEFLNQNHINRYDYLVSFINNDIESSLKKSKTLNPDLNNKQTYNNRSMRHNTNRHAEKNSKLKKNVWWNEECDRLIRVRNATFKSLKYRCDLEKLIQYKKIVAETKKKLIDIKRNSFRNFCQTFSKFTPITRVWSKIKMFKNGLNRPNFQNGNRQFLTDAEKAFQELGAPIETSFEALDLQRYKFNINEGNEFLTDPINYEELILVFSSVNAKSAPGVDKISDDIICSLPEFLLRTLLDIYNDCLHTGIFPQTWSEYLITFIPKSSNNCKSRPIALASCLLKVLEKIINNRLLYYVENQNLLSESQFGFRKSRSCIDNLSILVNYTQKAFFEGQRVVAVFLDIKGAYNNVVPELLVKDLAQLNIPLEYLKFFQQL